MCPLVDIGPAFAAAANAAFNTTLSPAFDPYANPLFFIHGAFIFEDVGVSAYQGAATALDGDLLTAAAGRIKEKQLSASNCLFFRCISLYSIKNPLKDKLFCSFLGILGVEAYHAGAIRTLLIQNSFVNTPYNVEVNEIVEAISTLRDTLDGPGETDYGILFSDGRTILAPVGEDGITKPRTARQVLNIVYGGEGNQGLFFPDGLNGNVK